MIDGDIETGIYTDCMPGRYLSGKYVGGMIIHLWHVPTTGFTKKNGKIPDGPPIGKGFDGLERFLKRETHERR